MKREKIIPFSFDENFFSRGASSTATSLNTIHDFVIRLVPDEMLQLIDGHCQWNEMIGEWQLKGVAYTGNNMMKRRSPPPPAHTLPNEDDNVYLVYNRGGDTGGSKKNGRKKKKNLQNELNQIMQ